MGCGCRKTKEQQAAAILQTQQLAEARRKAAEEVRAREAAAKAR